MDLHQLRSFVAVAQAGHVTRASEKLHLSQPTVSGHLRALEGDLGVTLFERMSSGVTLTHAGRLLLEDAEKVLASAQALRDHARAIGGTLDARLRIGTILDPAYLRLGDLLAVMRERYRLIEVELHLAVSGVGLEKVKNGELDAAFLLGDPDDADVRAIPLEPIRYVIAAPAAWRSRLKDWESLAKETWILPPPQGTLHQLARELLRAHRLAPASVMESDQESAILNLVAAGVGITLMREPLAREREAAGEIFIWPEGDTRTTLVLCYPAAREASPEILALVRAVEDVWGKKTGARRPIAEGA